MEHIHTILSLFLISVISLVAVSLSNPVREGMMSQERVMRVEQAGTLPSLPSPQKRAGSDYIMDDAAIQFVAPSPSEDSKPACPEGCLWGGKGIKVQMFNGVIITPKSNFVYQECYAPQEQCYGEGEVVKVKFKVHPYYKDPSVFWSMGGLKCSNHVWAPLPGGLTPCPPKAVPASSS